MESEKLQRLTDRANRASALAAEIASLQEADPCARGLDIRFRDNNTGQEKMSSSMLIEAILIGRKAIIDRKEAELCSLLVVEPELPQEQGE